MRALPYKHLPVILDPGNETESLIRFKSGSIKPTCTRTQGRPLAAVQLERVRFYRRNLAKAQEPHLGVMLHKTYLTGLLLVMA